MSEAEERSVYKLPRMKQGSIKKLGRRVAKQEL